MYQGPIENHRQYAILRNFGQLKKLACGKTMLGKFSPTLGKSLLFHRNTVVFWMWGLALGTVFFSGNETFDGDTALIGEVSASCTKLLQESNDWLASEMGLVSNPSFLLFLLPRYVIGSY